MGSSYSKGGLGGIFIERVVKPWYRLSRAVLESPSLQEFKSSTWGHGSAVTLAVLVGLGGRELFQLKQSCDSMSSPAQYTMQIHAERLLFGVPPQ